MQFSPACLAVIATHLLTPYYFAQGTSVNVIESGGDYSCAIGTVEGIETVIECWGSNATGQLDVPTSPQPSITGGDLSTGKDHACYLTATDVGDLFCWGRPDLVEIPSDLRNGVQLLATGGNHTCVSQYDSVDYQKVYCWGSSSASTKTDDNNNNNSIIISIDPPEDLGTPLTLDASISGTTTCSIAHNPSINNNTNRVVCWGCNDPPYDGYSVCQNTPALIPDFSYGVAVGLKHACIVSTVGGTNEQSITCWGDNSEGQYVNVPDVQNIVSITAGDYFTCVLYYADNGKQGSSVKCWGKNYDTVGKKYQIPKQLTEGGNRNVASISAGADHVCAIQHTGCTDTGVVCWGQNKDGQVSSIPSDFAAATESSSASGRFPSSIYFATVAVAFSAVTLLI